MKSAFAIGCAALGEASSLPHPSAIASGTIKAAAVIDLMLRSPSWFVACARALGRSAARAARLRQRADGARRPHLDAQFIDD
jgi:hypothetical protein